MTRRSTRILGIVAAGAIALSACASQGGGPSDEEPDRTGGAIRVAETNAFTSFNPSESSGNTDINGHIVRMTRSDFIYVDDELNIVPDTSFGTYEKLSDDPLVVRYTINESSVWSDGNAIDKADLLLNWAIQSGHFNGPFNAEGAPDPGFFVYAGSTDSLGLTGVPEFEDDRTMTLTYEQPYVDWEIAFSMQMPPAHVIADRAGMTEDELVTLLETATPAEENAQLSAVAEVWNTAFVVNTMPTGEDEDLLISSGPMIVTDFVPGESITVATNENYGGDREAQVDEIIVSFIGDAAAAVGALRNGEVDIIAPQPSVDTVDEVKKIDGVTVLEGADLSYDRLGLRLGVPDSPMADPDIREAFLMTVPREAILDRLIRTMNPEAEVVNSHLYLPSQGDLYTQAVAVNGSEAFAEVDIDGAKELLDGRTPEIRILYNSDNPSRVDTFAMIEESATEAGFQIIDSGLPNDDWGGQLRNPDMDVIVYGWGTSGIGSGVGGVRQVFVTGAGGNFNGYSNTEVDTLAERLLLTVDADAAAEIMREIDTLIFADNQGLPLFQLPGLIAHSDSIGGVTYASGMTGVWWNFWEWTVND